MGATIPHARRLGCLCPPAGRLGAVLPYFLLLGAILALSVPAAHAESAPRPGANAAAREVVVTNHSRQRIEQLYVSPSEADQWGPDWLGGGSMVPGAPMRVRLPRTGGCSVDIQVIYANAAHEERRGVDLCHTDRISFDGRSAVVPPGAAGDKHDITVSNESDRDIQQIFVSDAKANDWGDDRLGAQTLAVGKARGIPYRGLCGVDIRVVFDNRSAEERHGINVCAAPSLVVHPGWTTEDVPLPKFATPNVTPDGARTVDGASASPTRKPAEAVEMIDVFNRSTAPVIGIMLVPETGGGPDEGQDLLGGASLPRDGHMVAALVRGAGCRFTAHVRHGDGVVDQEVAGIDLCRRRTITVPAQ
jgi:hypothetical protein